MTENRGVLAKLSAQQESLNILGHTADTVSYSTQGILHNEQLIWVNKSGKDSFFTRLLFFKRIAQKINFKVYQIIIVRYGLADPYFIYLLKTINRQSEKARVYIDIPTFPYSKEWTGLRKWFLFFDYIFRKKAMNYVDAIISTSQRETIFRKSAIPITNGIDCEHLPVRKPIMDSKQVLLVAIAKWQYWHGLDRILYGLNDYYQKDRERIIRLMVLGKGPLSGRLRRLVKQLSLDPYVRFEEDHDMPGKNEVFNMAQLAIGTLGLHRKSVQQDSSLKHREYCARGIPFILSSPDLDFPSTLDFVKYVPCDDSPIRMETVLNFIDELMTTRGLEFEMRKYAEAKLNWTKRMKKVILYYQDMNNQ